MKVRLRIPVSIWRDLKDRFRNLNFNLEGGSRGCQPVPPLEGRMDYDFLWTKLKPHVMSTSFDSVHPGICLSPSPWADSMSSVGYVWKCYTPACKRIWRGEKFKWEQEKDCKVVALCTGLGLGPELLLPASGLKCAHGFTWGSQMDNSKRCAKMFPLGTLNVPGAKQGFCARPENV